MQTLGAGAGAAYKRAILPSLAQPLAPLPPPQAGSTLLLPHAFVDFLEFFLRYLCLFFVAVAVLVGDEVRNLNP